MYLENPYLSKYKTKRRLDIHYFRLIDSKSIFPSCYFCLRILPEDKTFACSPYCLKQLDMRASSGLLRHEILERDSRRCAKCGVHANALKIALGILKRTSTPEEYLAKLKELRIPPARIYKSSCLVDVDHIKRVADGGGAGIEGDIRLNLRLLCPLCHFNRNIGLW